MGVKTNKNKIVVALILIVLTLGLMTAIFSFSAQNSSETVGLSSKVTNFVAQIIFSNFSDYSNDFRIKVVDGLNLFIRKAAHFSLYFLLGGFVFMIFHTLFSRWKNLKKIGCVIAFSALYAGLDELHQLFVPGRSARFTDVLLDSLGALTGSIVCLCLVLLAVCIANEIKSKLKNK